MTFSGPISKNLSKKIMTYSGPNFYLLSAGFGRKLITQPFKSYQPFGQKFITWSYRGSSYIYNI
jgi:hypothetical protein